MLCQCDNCPALFRTNEEAEAHKASCANPWLWQCDYCPALFRTCEEAETHEASCCAKSADNVENRGVNVDLQAGRNKRHKENRIKQQNRTTKNYLPLSEYMVDTNKRCEGDDLLLKTYNATSDVVGLFAMAENIDSVVPLLHRVERLFCSAKEHGYRFYIPESDLRSAYVQIRKFPESIRQSSEHFCPFEGSPSHHPYHLHKTSLTKLSQQMGQAATSFHTL